MGIQDINDWNGAYGLGKVLLRNLVVGIILMLCGAVVWLTMALVKSNKAIQQVQNERIEDFKEYNTRLLREKEVRDSLQRVYIENYYKLKNP